MKGYLFNSESEAQAAQNLCDDHYSIPASPDSETLHWVAYEAWGDAWAIMADESLVVVLGEPFELPIIEDEQQ